MADARGPVVLIYDDMLASLQQMLRDDGHEVVLRGDLDAAMAPRVRAVVHANQDPMPLGFLEGLPNLGLLAHVSVGYAIDLDWCRARGIAVTHARGANADEVADHAMGLLVGGWRQIISGDRQVRAGEWRLESRLDPRPGLAGRLMGIVGLGHIGQAVARRAEAFGMDVAWWGPNPKPGVLWPRADDVLELARAADVLVVTARPDPSNLGLISRDVIEAVGPEGMIVNISRGSLIDEDALVEALRDGRLGKAGLDVFAEEPTPPARWAGVPNVVLTPHTAGSTVDSVSRMLGQTRENLRRFFAGEPLATPVDG